MKAEGTVEHRPVGIINSNVNHHCLQSVVYISVQITSESVAKTDIVISWYSHTTSSKAITKETELTTMSDIMHKPSSDMLEVVLPLDVLHQRAHLFSIEAK